MRRASPSKLPPSRAVRCIRCLRRSMSKRFSTRTSRLVALGAMLVLAAPLFAAKKDDLYKQAQAAADSGRVSDAARLYCDTAAEDPAYRDAKQLCTIFTQEAAREARRN